jgi:NAD(P)-dependent dehydrogenase (short-subunit alcohol dehydrogenase family)
VCSAGSTGGGPLETCTEEAFDALMDLNVKSVFFTLQKALRLLRDRASVVVIGSVADTITLPGGGVYSASKAALRAFVRTWANDLAPRGVRVNLLSPGITETPLLSRLQSTPQSLAGFDHLIAHRTALKRRGRAEEVGSVAAFLASDAASYVTGGVIYVDGGMAGW